MRVLLAMLVIVAFIGCGSPPAKLTLKDAQGFKAEVDRVAATLPPAKATEFRTAAEGVFASTALAAGFSNLSDPQAAQAAIDVAVVAALNGKTADQVIAQFNALPPETRNSLSRFTNNLRPPSQKSPPTPSPPAPATDFPKSIRIGDIEVTPIAAKVGIVELKMIGGSGKSENEHFTVEFKIVNHSKVKRLPFAGWPEKDSIFVNLRASDEHDNEYKALNFGIGSRVLNDSGGETIEPEQSGVAIVGFETPVTAANTLIIELDGEAIGKPDEKLRWKLSRAQWQ